MDKTCGLRLPYAHSSFSTDLDALERCKKSSDCFGVYDDNCDGSIVFTHSNAEVPGFAMCDKSEELEDSLGDCIYAKRGDF